MNESRPVQEVIQVHAWGCPRFGAPALTRGAFSRAWASICTPIFHFLLPADQTPAPPLESRKGSQA